MKCNYKHKQHESKEGLVKEALEHEPTMHKVPKTTLSLRNLKSKR